MALSDGRADTRSTPTNLDWSNPDSNLWVAAANGDYAGLVEFVDGHFGVRNSTGAVVAVCASIPAAQAALARHRDAPGSSAETAVSPMTGRSRSRRAPRPAYLRDPLAA
jgi:hypothetical protein